MFSLEVRQKKPTKGFRERQETFFFPVVFSLQGKQAELELKKEVRLRLEFFFFGLGLVGLGSEGGKGQGIKLVHDLGGNIYIYLYF